MVKILAGEGTEALVILIKLNIICSKTMETFKAMFKQRLSKPCMNLFAGEPGGIQFPLNY